MKSLKPRRIFLILLTLIHFALGSYAKVKARVEFLLILHNLGPKEIKQLGFMISDKQVGNFHLEINWIGVN